MSFLRRDVLQAKQLRSELLQGLGGGNCFREFADALLLLLLFLFADVDSYRLTGV